MYFNARVSKYYRADISIVTVSKLWYIPDTKKRKNKIRFVLIHVLYMYSNVSVLVSTITADGLIAVIKKQWHRLDTINITQSNYIGICGYWNFEMASDANKIKRINFV